MGGIWGDAVRGDTGSGATYPSVNTFADLPDPSLYTGSIYVVLTASGVWPFNRKPAGMYRSDGAAWNYMSAYPDIVKDGNFGIQNSTDPTKAFGFSAANIDNGTTRTITVANRNFDMDKPETTYHDHITGLANPAYKEGRTFYDHTKKALSYYNNEADITVNLGQEILIQVRNETGATIPNGSAVYPSGVSGGNVLIGLATAADKDKCRLVGIVTHDIENNTNGYVTKFGEVGSLDTSAFVSGNTLYLDTTAGLITDAKPSGSAFITQIGVVKTVSATVGSIVVDISITEFSVEASSVVGWSPSDTATINFVDGTRTLTITPTGLTFSFYQSGDKYSKATDSIVIDDTEGMWVIYYNMGTLQKLLAPTDAQVSSLIRNNPIVAYVYWNATDNKAEYIGYELHEIGMSADTHNYAHFSFGARYLNGLLPTDVTADQSGNTDSHAQFGVSTGAFADEDNYFPVNTIASTAGLPIAYLAGTEAAPTLRITTRAGFSVLAAGTGRVAFNTISAGSWVLTESTNLDYVCCHVVSINENAIGKRVVAFVGQANYATSADARTGAALELKNLKRTGILPQETVQLATFIFQTADSYGNTPKARIISIDTDNDWIDWTGGAVSSPGSSVVQSSFSDADFELFDDGDVSKIGKFQLSGVTTATTRTITWPDRNLDLNDPRFLGTVIQPLAAANPILDFPSNNSYRFIGDGTNDTATIFDAILNLGANGDTYKQVNVFNASNGSSASADYVATANNGTDTTHYVNLGINSGSFSAGGGALGGGANVGYLICKDDELHVFTGAAQALRFGVNNTEYLTVQSGGVVTSKTEILIGTPVSGPIAALNGRGVQVWKNTNAEAMIFTHSAAATQDSVLRLGQSGGTVGSPTATVTGQGGMVSLIGHDGTNFVTVGKAAISLTASGDWSPTSQPAKIEFYTTPSASTTRALRATIFDTGRMAINRTAAAAPLHVEATASGINEIIQRWTVSDDAGSYMEARNGLASTSASRFNPCLYGLSSNTSDPCLTIWGGLPGQTGTTPAVLIKADYNAAAVTSRSILAVRNHTTDMFIVSALSNIVLGSQSALATNATDGFTYIPTCAGTPTGVPTSYTGKVALVFDTTNNKMYVYDAAWVAIN